MQILQDIIGQRLTQVNSYLHAQDVTSPNDGSSQCIYLNKRAAVLYLIG